MKLAIVLAIFTGILVLSCSSDSDIPSESTSNSGSTIETRAAKLPPKQQPYTSSSAKSEEELGIYFEQTVTTHEEFVGVMQSLADWQDAAYPEMQRMTSSSQVTRSDVEAWLARQQVALEQAFTGLRDLPAKWAAISPPDDLVEYHNLMLQVVRLKLEAVQKWQAGAVLIQLDADRSLRLTTEGDRLDDQADGIYLQAVAEGTKKGLPFGP